MGTALPTYLVPKGCSKRALLGVASGNSPSSQSCQSSDLSDAKRKRGRHHTTHEKTKDQACRKAIGTPRTPPLHGLKQSSKSKANRTPSCMSSPHQCRQGCAKWKPEPSPFLSHFLPRSGGSNPSEVHADPPARPSLHQHVLNSGFPSPRQRLLPKTPSHSCKEQRRRPLGFTLKSWP